MFDLKSYLSEKREVVDAALDAELPAATERPTGLHEAMRYSVFSGGKRLRPILCLAAAEACGADPQRALLPAVSIELLHTYTLVHDDLPCMDDDDLRRGRPTVHRVYGEANAVLTGDALQARAFEVISRATVPPPYTIADLLAELSQAAGSRGVVGGQVEDIAAGSTADRETVQFVHLHKTADLFRLSMRMGAIATGANAHTLDALTEYGVNLGLAFQITDDILDASPGADAPPTNGELSCLTVCSRTEALAEATALISNARSRIKDVAQAGHPPLLALADFVLARDH